MSTNRLSRVVFRPLVLLLVVAGCSSPSTEEGSPAEGSQPAPEPQETQSVEEAQMFLEEAARKRRAALVDMTFDEFKEGVYQEPFEGGKFIVNGDTTVVDEKHLREFFEGLRAAGAEVEEETAPPQESVALILAQAGGLDLVWNSAAKKDLTYCVSTTFGDRYDSVVAQMAVAAGEWEAVADLDMRHEPSQDDNCTATNDEVVFDVRPVSHGGYLARAFFPNEPRSTRNVLIDDSSFGLAPPPAKLQLVGILRHELGHALGFRHEHTRPDAGTCFEDVDWRTVTDYDPFSVMHYPQCNGQGDWSLTLTDRDKNGAACIYGAAAGFTIDPEICEPEVEGNVAAGEPRTETFAGESVAIDAMEEYRPFDVAAGSIFEASISGTGDPDLYVRFGVRPSLLRYNCRPYWFGAEESCAVEVPAGEVRAFVMVHGYESGNYDLTVTFRPPE